MGVMAHPKGTGSPGGSLAHWSDKLQRFDRRWIFLIMGLAIVVPLYLPLGFPIKARPMTKAAFNAVEELHAGDVVFVSLDLDPASTAILTDEAMILYDAGSHAEGRAQLQRVIALDPANVDAHLYLAQIARYEGRADEYRNEMARADKLRGLRAADPSMATAGPRHAGVPTSTR